jgi:hypothetical protein
MTTPDDKQHEAPAGGASTPANAPNRRVTRWLTPVLALVAALVIGLFGGILIGQNTASSSQATGVVRPGGGQGGFGQGGTGPGGAGAAAGFTAGTIVSVNGTSIVVKKQDGSQVTVSTTGATTVTKTQKAAVTDLKAGETVTVRGQADASGNVAATSISQGSGLFGGGRPGQQPPAGN